MKRFYSGLVIVSVLFILATGCTKRSDRISEVVYVRHQGADMPAYIHGNPDSDIFLIVLHGAGSFGLAFRDGAFTDLLEENYVVVYWDQRGQGMAQGHYKKPGDLVNLMAKDVKALTEVLGEKYGPDKEFFLLGHSWGGLLGATALLDPELQQKFNGWICVDGAVDLQRATEARFNTIVMIANEQISLGNDTTAWKKLRDGITELDPNADENYAAILGYAKKTMNLLQTTGIIESTTNEEKIYRTLMDNNPFTWQVSNFFNKPVNVAIEENYSVMDRLDEIKIPSLLIYGKYDVSVPASIGYAAYDSLGSSTKAFAVFDHSIHHPMDTEPGKFGILVFDFIESN